MSYSVTGTTITMTRGDTVRIQFGINLDGEPYNPLDGDVVRFAAKRKWSDAQPCINKNIPNETMVLTLNPLDTKNLDFGTYYYDVQITFANGDVATFITEAKLFIMKEVC